MVPRGPGTRQTQVTEGRGNTNDGFAIGQYIRNRMGSAFDFWRYGWDSSSGFLPSTFYRVYYRRRYHTSVGIDPDRSADHETRKVLSSATIKPLCSVIPCHPGPGRVRQALSDFELAGGRALVIFRGVGGFGFFSTCPQVN